MRAELRSALKRLEDTVAFLLESGKQDLRQALAVATPFLSLCGTIVAGWLLARAAASAARLRAGDPGFAVAKAATAAFFIENLLPEANADAAQVTRGGPTTLGFPLEAF